MFRSWYSEKNREERQQWRYVVASRDMTGTSLKDELQPQTLRPSHDAHDNIIYIPNTQVLRTQTMMKEEVNWFSKDTNQKFLKIF